MIVLAPGTVTFNVTTLFDCPFLSDPFQYAVVNMICTYDIKINNRGG